MSNYFYNTTGASDYITITGSTAGNITSTLTDSSGMWFPNYQDTTWMPYVPPKYKPRWHILQGYKIQMSKMWDEK